MAETFTDKLKLSKRDTGDLNWGQGANSNMEIIDAYMQQAKLRPPRAVTVTLGSGAVGPNLTGNSSFYYKVTAVNAAGETTEGIIPSVVEGQVMQPGAPLPVIIQWERVTGANGYKIYKANQANQEKFLTSVVGESTVTFTDNGNNGINPGMSVPTTNTASLSSGGGVSDHGALSGLGDDDHQQYLKKSGDSMSGNLTVGGAAGGGMFDTAVIPNSGRGYDSAFDGTNYWVTNPNNPGGCVYKYNSTGDWVATYENPAFAGHSLQHIIYANGFLWIGTQSSNKIFRMDPAGVVTGIDTMWPIRSLTWDGTYLWGVQHTNGKLVRIDATTPFNQTEFNCYTHGNPIPAANPNYILYNAGSLWVADRQGHLDQYSSATGGQTTSFGIAIPLYNLHFDGTYIWCFADQQQQFIRFNPANPAETTGYGTSFPVQTGVVVDGNIWAVGTETGQGRVAIQGINISNGQTVNQFVAANPDIIGSVAGHVWFVAGSGGLAFFTHGANGYRCYYEPALNAGTAVSISTTGKVTANNIQLTQSAAPSRVLVCQDAAGNATWQQAASSGVGGSGTTGTMPIWDGATSLANSSVLVTTEITGDKTYDFGLNNKVKTTHLESTNVGGPHFGIVQSKFSLYGTLPCQISTDGMTTSYVMDNLGVGTATPSTKLDVAGSVKIADGTQGAGKVLTSNASGLATWQTPASGGGGYATVVVAAPTGIAATDSTNINAALTAVNGLGGGSVILREGTYKINATLTPYAKTRIIGQGKLATVLLADSTFSRTLKTVYSTAAGISIENLTIDLNFLPRGGYGYSLGADIQLDGGGARLYMVKVTKGCSVTSLVSFAGAYSFIEDCELYADTSNSGTANMVVCNGVFTGNYLQYEINGSGTILTVSNGIASGNTIRLYGQNQGNTLAILRAADCAAIGNKFIEPYLSSNVVSNITATGKSRICGNSSDNTYPIGSIDADTTAVIVLGNSGFSAYTGGTQACNI